MPQKVKVQLGSKNPKTIDVPDIGNLIEHPNHESLMFFGTIPYDEYLFKNAFGIGIVWKISHNEKFDCIYVKFGENSIMRKIIVIDNHSRRQLMSIKRSHVISFYGYAKVVRKADRKGKLRNYIVLFAKGLQDWYVPRELEIKKNRIENTDYDNMSSQEEIDLENYIDQFDLNGGKDYE